MTLVTRILVYYSATLLCSLVLVGIWSLVEFSNLIAEFRQNGMAGIDREGGAMEESLEIVFYAGFPAMVIGVIAGRLMMRRALQPIQSLTEALERTDVSNLGAQVPLRGNGDELDRMTAVFNRMTSRLDASFTQARDFTLHSSHELKTPLTIVHGNLEQMLEEGRLNPQDKARVESVLEEVQRLSGILRHLSFLARADARQLKLNRAAVPLGELVEDLADEARILAAGRDIDVRLAACEPVTIDGDRVRMRQLLLNLADNAVKHNHDHGSVEMALHLTEGYAELTISNTGPTVSAEARTRVFERFFRGDAAHGAEVEGSGLGLSIAHVIAEAHGGRIDFSTTENGRTMVKLILPVITA